MSLDVPGTCSAGGTDHELVGGIHHVAVQTAWLDNSIRWYQDFFSCEVSWALDEFSALTRSRLPGITRLVELRTSGIRFHVFTKESAEHPQAAPEANQFQHLCLRVSSPESLTHWRDKWLRLFSSGQYTFSRSEQATEIDTDPDGMKSFYTYDVNGLEYEFSFIPGTPRD